MMRNSCQACCSVFLDLCSIFKKKDVQERDNVSAAGDTQPFSNNQRVQIDVTADLINALNVLANTAVSNTSKASSPYGHVIQTRDVAVGTVPHHTGRRDAGVTCEIKPIRVCRTVDFGVSATLEYRTKTVQTMSRVYENPRQNTTTNNNNNTNSSSNNNNNNNDTGPRYIYDSSGRDSMMGFGGHDCWHPTSYRGDERHPDVSSNHCLKRMTIRNSVSMPKQLLYDELMQAAKCKVNYENIKLATKMVDGMRDRKGRKSSTGNISPPQTPHRSTKLPACIRSSASGNLMCGQDQAAKHLLKGSSLDPSFIHTSMLFSTIGSNPAPRMTSSTGGRFTEPLPSHLPAHMISNISEKKTHSLLSFEYMESMFDGSGRQHLTSPLESQHKAPGIRATDTTVSRAKRCSRRTK